MKPQLLLSLIVALFIFTACKKDSTTINPETKLLLQNKWTLISSNVVFPTNTTLNSRYIAAPSDYYLFGTNDSLIIKQAGQINLLTIPLNINTTYSFIDNIRLKYGLNSSNEINIITLTNNLLVLSNNATSTFTTSGTVVATYEGLKTDSLKR
jgi:uncharacterized lipoprotein YajG